MSQDHLQRRSFQFDDAPRTTIALEPGFWCLLEQISALRRLRLERVVADALAIQGELDRAAAIRLYVGNYVYKSALDTNVPTSLPPIPGSVPIIHNADTAPVYWMANVLWMVLADGNDTGGRFSTMEQLLPKGSGPGPHKHTWSDETFYMLDGEITLLIGDEIRTARKGDFVMVPRDTRHAFRVDSETARFLNGYTPASMEALIIERGVPTTERVLPPKNMGPPPVMSSVLPGRYGMDALPGPDPLRPNGR